MPTTVESDTRSAVMAVSAAGLMTMSPIHAAACPERWNRMAPPRVLLMPPSC
jgi:hypothetical protein